MRKRGRDCGGGEGFRPRSHVRERKGFRVFGTPREAGGVHGLCPVHWRLARAFEALSGSPAFAGGHEGDPERLEVRKSHEQVGPFEKVSISGLPKRLEGGQSVCGETLGAASRLPVRRL